MNCGGAYCFERLQFGFAAQTVSGFGLDGGCAVVGHVAKGGKQLVGERGLGSFAHAVDARANATAGFGDFFVTGAGNALLEVQQPRLGEHRVGMGVYKAGQHDAATAVDLHDFLAILLEPRITQGIFARSHRNNLAAKAEHGRVLNDAEIGKESAAAGTGSRGAQG